MKMREKIEKWFRYGLWTETMVLKAVEKGLLTQDEAEKIIGGDSHDPQ